MRPVPELFCHLQVSFDQVADLTDLDAETVLCGKGGDPDRVVVDPVFAKTFASVEADLIHHLGIRRDPDVLPQAVGTAFRAWIDWAATADPILLMDGGWGRVCEMTGPDGETVGLGDDLDGYRLVGMLYDCDLVVQDAYRGRGIGRAIIAARLITYGDLPTWDHDKPGYSPGGEACVWSGLRLAQALVELAIATRPTP